MVDTTNIPDTQIKVPEPSNNTGTNTSFTDSLENLNKSINQLNKALNRQTNVLQNIEKSTDNANKLSADILNKQNKQYQSMRDLLKNVQRVRDNQNTRSFTENPKSSAEDSKHKTKTENNTNTKTTASKENINTEDNKNKQNNQSFISAFYKSLVGLFSKREAEEEKRYKTFFENYRTASAKEKKAIKDELNVRKSYFDAQRKENAYLQSVYGLNVSKDKTTLANEHSVVEGLGTHLSTTFDKSALLSTGISALSAGLINPAIVQALGIDKVVSNTISNFFRKDADDDNGRKKGPNASAVLSAERDETVSILRQINNGINALNQKKPVEEKEEKKKTGFLSSLLGFIKSGLGFLFKGAIGLLASSFINKIAGPAQKFMSEALQNLGLSEGVSNALSGVALDFAKGFALGAPFGLKAGLVFGLVRVAWTGIAKLINKVSDFVEGFVTDHVLNPESIIGMSVNKFKQYVAAYQEGGIVGLGLMILQDVVGGFTSLAKRILPDSVQNFFKGDEEEKKAEEEAEKQQIKRKKEIEETEKKLQEYRKAEQNQTKLPGAKDYNYSIDKYLHPVPENVTPIPSGPQKMQSMKPGYEGDAPDDNIVPLNESINRNTNFPPDIMGNVQSTRNNVINPLQSALNQQFGDDKYNVIITSSYRDPQYNASVGGAKRSRHLTGKAMDIVVPGLTPEQVIGVMQKNNIPFSRAIAEKSGGKRWTHVEYDKDAKRTGVVASLQNGVYKQEDNGLNSIQIANNDENTLGQLIELTKAKAAEVEMANAAMTSENNSGYRQGGQDQAPIIYNNNVYNNGQPTVYPVGDFAQTLQYS